jgi:acetyl esterase/lipase
MKPSTHHGTALIVWLGCAALMAQTGHSQSINLWPQGAPGPKATSEQESDATTAKDSRPGGKPVIRLSNVTEPSITVYPARPANQVPGTAVVVFPGGGYRILAWDLEGTEICSWLNSIGVTAVLLKYRVPEPAGQARYAAPLQDAQRAMGLVRSHAKEWGLDPSRVGVLGFSAGGHLAAVLGNHAQTRTYPRLDDTDALSCHPNFVLLIYPAYLSVEDKGAELAPEVAVNGDTPKTFIVQTEDDHNFVEGTLLYYRALKKGTVPAELHLFPEGGHGYGLRPSAARVTSWPALAEAWLRSLEFISPDGKT